MYAEPIWGRFTKKELRTNKKTKVTELKDVTVRYLMGARIFLDDAHTVFNHRGTAFIGKPTTVRWTKKYGWTITSAETPQMNKVEVMLDRDGLTPLWNKGVKLTKYALNDQQFAKENPTVAAAYFAARETAMVDAMQKAA